jgi:hypothetical protein
MAKRLTDEELEAQNRPPLPSGPAGSAAGLIGQNDPLLGYGANADADGDGTPDWAEEVAATRGDGKQVELDENGNVTPETDLERFQRILDGINERRDEVTGELGGELSGLEGAAQGADVSDNYALAQYLSEMSGYDPLEASEYVGDYESGGEGFEAQEDALGRFKALSSPTVTAEEKFLQEQARVSEERDRRSAMDAAMRDLDARGARSGGAEIAALTGAQDITSQNRLMSDLGTQANAVNRSMRALEGYGSTASDMRGADDRVGMFNNKLMSDYNVWKDDFAARERDSAVDRTGQTRDARNDVTNRMFGRQGALYNEKEDLAGMKLGVEGDKESGASSYTQLMLGDKAAQQAAAELKKDKPWEIGDPILLDDLFGSF